MYPLEVSWRFSCTAIHDHFVMNRNPYTMQIHHFHYSLVPLYKYLAVMNRSARKSPRYLFSQNESRKKAMNSLINNLYFSLPYVKPASSCSASFAVFFLSAIHPINTTKKKNTEKIEKYLKICTCSQEA